MSKRANKYPLFILFNTTVLFDQTTVYENGQLLSKEVRWVNQR